jgi:methylenetetrahydrofolate reductase (NADPH)
MKILHPQISFEFFPPKTQEGRENLHHAALLLSHHQPSFFSVTFGAGGSTREHTLEIVRKLQKETPISVAPHLSCIGANRMEIIEVLKSYQTLGMKRIVALRGDLPSGIGQTGEFQFASELVALIRETMGDYFHIEVAAYPEIHPQAISATDDILNLKRKYEAGANSAITQYFFNPDAYFYYLDECAKHGINLSITPGIMPIYQFHKLVRFSDTCGAEIPRWIRKRLESYGDDIDSIKEFGFEVIYDLCERLLHGGAPGLHFYTLNRANPCIELLHTLGFLPQFYSREQLREISTKFLKKI